MLLLIAISIIFKDQLKLIYANPEAVKAFLTSFGYFAPLILILIQMLQVIIFVIPGPVFTISGGYVFGPLLGSVYSLIGTLLGSILVFILARKYGRPWVENLVNQKDLHHFDAYFKKKGKLALLITRTIPVLFPNDVVSFAAGLTPLTLRSYFFISLIGFIPNLFLLNFFGDNLSNNMNPTTIIILAALGVIILAYFARHKIKKLCIKAIYEFEEELKSVEEKSLNEVKIIEKEVKADFKYIKNEFGHKEKVYA